MSLIVIVDDELTHRHIARRALGSRSGIFIPEYPEDVSCIDPRDVGLLIVDRMMSDDWRRKRDDLIARVRRENPECVLAEWSIACGLDEENRLQDMDYYVQKASSKAGPGGELLDLVDQWIRNEVRRESGGTSGVMTCRTNSGNSGRLGSQTV